MLDLHLYLSGRTPTGDAMIGELKTILEAHGIDYRLQVKDVFSHPEDSFEDTVYATPTLVKRFPPPVARIIGDLTNRERVLVGLKIGGEQD